jgi:Skp family chaperone for outer membrane proteins
VDFYYFWDHLTDAQATLLAAGGTMVSALVVAILGPLLFKSALGGISEAADAAKQSAGKITSNFNDLNEQFSAFEKNLAGLQNKINDLAADTGDDPAAAEAANGSRQQLKDAWFELRDLLEGDASDKRLNGHTRGKYSRIDRRDPAALFDAMQADHNLRGDRTDWNRAQEIYFTFRSTNSPPPAVSDLAELLTLKNKLKGAPFEPRKSTRRPPSDNGDPPKDDEPVS